LQAAYNADYGDMTSGNPDNNMPAYPYLSSARLSSSMFGTQDTPSNLERFRNRVAVAQIPVAVLTLQIILLILFFVSLMTSLLVERQTDTIALLRSRGASAGQVFGALLTQCVGMGLFAIIIGVPLAILTVIWLSPRILTIGGQDALNFITENLSSVLQRTALYACGIVVVVLITMGVSLFLVARMDVLAIRREATRANKRPLWQRLNLDVIAGVIALVGYGLSFYVTSIGDVLQGDAKALIATPLSIIAPFFLVIGCMFLFLRIFPLFLRLAAFLSARGRGAVSMLALAQVARAPRQSIRMTMLLALAIAFGLFTLIYTATQTQHIQDLTTYQVGADFSGELPSGAMALLDPVKTTKDYRAIPGVTSASVGYVGHGDGGKANLSMEVRAVDASTFGRTVIWPSPAASQSANALLKKLVAGRGDAIANDFVPVIVDTTTLNVLQLHVGDTFTIKVDNQTQRDMHCGIIGVVPHIPTINDRTASLGVNSNKGFMVVGGVLVDYQTYAAVYVKDARKNGSLILQLDTPSINHVWLSTKSDEASLASVRTALSRSNLRLNNLTDRRELLISLKSDPLYVVLGGVLGIGTVTALLLALVGDLLASWLSARTRLTNFAILRALGTTPQQVASILTWEQAIVYITGLLLGVGFGFLLSMTVIPSLTFTTLNADLSNNQFYALQTALPTSVVLPPTLPLALLVLVAIYVLALTMMVRVVSRPSLSQALRLSED
jgi:ABC-type lipoprotein release transport system permease subunit